MIKLENCTALQSDEILKEISSIAGRLGEQFGATEGVVNGRESSGQLTPMLKEALEMLRKAQAYQTSAPFRGGLSGWQSNAIKRYIQTYIGNRPTVADFAGAMNLSCGHFSQAFKVTFGCSPMEFTRRERIKLAEHLLETTTLPLGEVAVRCGFADQAHLTRSFQTLVGATPRQWRLRVGSSPKPVPPEDLLGSDESTMAGRAYPTLALAEYQDAPLASGC